LPASKAEYVKMTKYVGLWGCSKLTSCA